VLRYVVTLQCVSTLSERAEDVLQVAKCPMVDGLLVVGRNVTWGIYARDNLGGFPVTGVDRTRGMSHLRVITGRLPCK
jgi:hypothetical protein